jgi:hypothetical protein
VNRLETTGISFVNEMAKAEAKAASASRVPAEVG